MGDTVASTEMEGEKEEEMMMAHRCAPIFPLPEEIKKMERSETVCRYCGVSYLIYHEFQQLHTRLAQLEAELQKVTESAQRDKAQREALELEWERALYLEVQRRAEEREARVREQLEKENSDTESFLREEFGRKMREMEEDHRKVGEEKAKQLRRELERGAQEREALLSEALRKANENSDQLRKYLQQVEQGLAEAVSAKEAAERLLGKEKERGEIPRGVCMRQEKLLRATLSTLRSTARELADVRGFLSLLTGAWQAFKSQILQHSTQALSVLQEELKHSGEELQKMSKERERLTLELMEQRRRREAQLSRQEESEKEHRVKILRLEGELEEKRERLLSRQQRCDTIEEQLSSWQEMEKQTHWKYCTVEEEVARLREALDKVQQEAGELRKERDPLIASHGRALKKMEEEFTQQMASKLEQQRSQSALHLKEQMEEVQREAELERAIDREKNQLLLLQYQRENTQLQRKQKQREQELGGLREELQRRGRGSREEEERRRGREEETQQELRSSRQQEALQLSRAQAQLQLINERSAELQEEVVLLQETVRRECQEREDLTAALSRAQEELLWLHSPASHQGSPPNSMDRHTHPGHGNSHLPAHARVPLTRSATSPNALRRTPACTEKDRGPGTGGGDAGTHSECWNGGAGKQRGRTLPRLKRIQHSQ